MVSLSNHEGLAPRCGASWFDKLTMKRFPHPRSGSEERAGLLRGPVRGRPVLLLDAMGVIYRVGDDVADLLIPFIAEHGGSRDRDRISALYMEASLGRLSPAAFWRDVGVNDALEADYLDRFELT